MSYGGLKDRHAVTSQYLTVYRGPRRDLQFESIAVTYLGQLIGPVHGGRHRGQPFHDRDAVAARK